MAKDCVILENKVILYTWLISYESTTFLKSFADENMYI